MAAITLDMAMPVLTAIPAANQYTRLHLPRPKPRGVFVIELLQANLQVTPIPRRRL